AGLQEHCFRDSATRALRLHIIKGINHLGNNKGRNRVQDRPLDGERVEYFFFFGKRKNKCW
ncbi:Uncharacterized protein APZ42_006150, partial [Daphnia magna]